MKKNLLISLAVVIVLIVSFGLIFLSLRTTLALNYLNDHLDAGGLRMGMPEREVVKLIGKDAIRNRELWGRVEKSSGTGRPIRLAAEIPFCRFVNNPLKVSCMEPQ